MEYTGVLPPDAPDPRLEVLARASIRPDLVVTAVLPREHLPQITVALAARR